MNKSSNSRSSMFLMEIIVAILFFSLVSAVCLRIFTTSHQQSADTKNLNVAVNQAGSAAEILKDSNGGLQVLKQLYKEAVTEGQDTVVYFDENWEACQPSSGTYRMVISSEDADVSGLRSYKILIGQTGGAEIYSLTLSVHEPLHS